LRIYLGNGTSTFGSEQEFSSFITHQWGAIVADFSGDGHYDYAFFSGALRILRGLNSSGTSWNLTTLLAQPTYIAPIPGSDLNGDGYLDLISPSGAGVMLSYSRPETEVSTIFNTTNQRRIISTDQGSVRVGDLDGDGKLDISRLNPVTNTLYVNRGL
jgi:hypothetical protein